MTTPDNEARTILGEAIIACNALIIHLNNHPDTFPAATRQRMIEADYLLNSASTDVADFVGEFHAPVVAPIPSTNPARSTHEQPQ